MKNTFTSILLCELFLLFGFSQTAQAASGDLDTIFNGTGKVTAAFGGSTYNYASDVKIQSDGKIVVGGISSLSIGRYVFAIARYNSNGTPDNSFGINGQVTTDLGTSTNGISKIEIQPDGKILAAEYFGGRIIRYNNDGSPDTNFGNNGIVTVSYGSRSAGLLDIKLQSDGKIVVSGSYYQSSLYDEDFIIARYNSNGSIDTTFDGDGIQTTNFNRNYYCDTADRAASIVIQPDGKIIAAGYSFFQRYSNDPSCSNYSDQFISAVRYNSNGSLDTTFGTGGKIIYGSYNSYPGSNSVKLQSDGKIVIVGYVGGSVLILRYNSNGTFDNTFDGDGVAAPSLGANAFQSIASAIQSDGKILVAGTKQQLNSNDFAIARINPNGSLDSSLSFSFNYSTNLYGVNGVSIIDFGGSDDLGGMALDSAGRAVLVGRTSSSNSNQFAIARLLGDLGTTAANVSVGGRVLAANGRGISNVRVSITDANGNNRTVLSNTFGYYYFDELAAGQTYILQAQAKRYRFTSPTQVLSVNEELSGVNFTAYP